MDLQLISPKILSRFSKRGFTLTELVVVVAILVVLMALVVVAAKKAVLMARTAKCLSNQRQIAIASVSYANDNNSAFVSNRTSTDGNFNYSLVNACGTFPILINNGNTANDGSYHSWTASYGTNMIGTRERESALRNGRLFEYMGAIGLYRSPLEPETDRLRSYSLNSFVGGTVPEDSNEWSTKWDDWFCAKGVTPTMWRTTHMARIPNPSQTICSITEDDSDGFNFNNQGWVIDPRTPGGTPDSNPVAAVAWEGWIDWPAFWDPSNITYSYVDGSTESYSVQARQAPHNLVSAIQGPPGAGFGHRYAEPAVDGFRRDWYHFRERLCPGIIPKLPVAFTPGG